MMTESDGGGGARINAEEVCRWIDKGGGSRYSERFWTLDPIDGTKGFLRGEQYAVALALIVKVASPWPALACPNLCVQPGTEQRGRTTPRCDLLRRQRAGGVCRAGDAPAVVRHRCGSPSVLATPS